MTREYVLMNRDLPMLRFSCERNAFDEPEFFELEWLTELRPIGYGRLHFAPNGKTYYMTANQVIHPGYFSVTYQEMDLLDRLGEE